MELTPEIMEKCESEIKRIIQLRGQLDDLKIRLQEEAPEIKQNKSLKTVMYYHRQYNQITGEIKQLGAIIIDKIKETAPN